MLLTRVPLWKINLQQKLQQKLPQDATPRVHHEAIFYYRQPIRVSTSSK